MIYQWPKFSDIYGDFGQRRGLDPKIYFIRQGIRYYLRCLLARREIKQFVMFVNQNHKLVDFFSFYRGGAYRIVCTGFVDRLLSQKDRLRLIEYNLGYVQNLAFFDEFMRRQSKVLYSSDWGFEIVFWLNGTFEEGFFALELRLENKRIYGLSFCFLEEKGGVEFLIASLQGLDQGEEIREKIKIITKKCFGLRPQNLLVEIARLVARFKHCKALLGIPQASQIRYSPFGKKGYFVDYDALWQEFGGEKRGGYYDLTQEQRKDLESIPSQKRSMYKKRFAFLDELEREIGKRLKELGF